ncbi:MAG: hypothetical protein GX543_17495 [Gordonia sp.]|nr:hypothetical protein [Gordonia sp. (in: high G+C Gram-positive bacteria)]
MLGTTVDRGLVYVGEKLGDGGTATVYRATVPELGAVAFKEYRVGRDDGLCSRPDAASVQRLMARIMVMSTENRSRWLDSFAWPLALVESDGQPVGYLMPLAPDRFHVDYVTGNGARQRTTRRFADMQLLLNSPEFLAHRGIGVSRDQQLQLLRSAAEGFAKLHANGLVAGDVSARNLAFDVSANDCAVYFIDCDAMTEVTRSGGGRYMETAEWTVPVAIDGSREQLNTVATDSYKFGLLVLRLLTGRQDARDPILLPGDVSSLRPLLTQALADDPLARPRPADWVPSLIIAIRRISADRPEAVRGRIDRGLVPQQSAVEPAAAGEYLRSPEHRNDFPRMEAPCDSEKQCVSTGVGFDQYGLRVHSGSDDVTRLDDADLSARDRQRIVGRIARCLTTAAERGLSHPGLTIDNVGIHERGGKLEPVIFGFEEMRSGVVATRPPGFDQLVLKILRAESLLASSRKHATPGTEFRPGATCGEYVAQVVALLKETSEVAATKVVVSEVPATTSGETPVSMRMRLVALLGPGIIAVLAFTAPWMRVKIDGEPYVGFSLARTIVDTPSTDVITEIPSDNAGWAVALAVIAAVLGVRSMVARDAEAAAMRVAGGGLVLAALVVAAWVGRSDWSSDHTFVLAQQGGFVSNVSFHMAWGYWLSLFVALASVAVAAFVYSFDEVRFEKRARRIEER